MSDRDKIKNYLKSLGKYLARLDSSEANEVIREIESHIFDVIDAKEQAGDDVDIKNILEGFGPPRVLASAYVEHILTGAPPPKGFKTIQKIKQNVSKSVWYSMAIFGYGISGFVALIAVLKIMYPNDLGIWVTGQGNSIVITFDQYLQPNATELLGWWLGPVCLLVSGLIFILTKKVLKSLKMSLLKATNWAD